MAKKDFIMHKFNPHIALSTSNASGIACVLVLDRLALAPQADL